MECLLDGRQETVQLCFAYIFVSAWKFILRENILSFEGKSYYLTGQVL